MEIRAKSTINFVAEHCELLIYRLNDNMLSDIDPQDKTNKAYVEGRIAAYQDIIRFVRGL